MIIKTQITESICDITDGALIRKLNQKNPFDLKLTVLVNTDGIQVSKSGKKSLWPIQVICNFLPPAIRFNRTNIILAGIYLDVKKPNIMEFFQPLAEEFAMVNAQGIAIVRWKRKHFQCARNSVQFRLTCPVDGSRNQVVHGV